MDLISRLKRKYGEDVAAARLLCRTVAKNGTAIEIRRRSVNGRELQERVGVRPERTGELLRRLQDLVWQEPARNKKSILLELAGEIIVREEDFQCV